MTLAFPKDQHFESEALRAAARAEGAHCVRCGRVTGNVCGRHYTGDRQHQYGKGRGRKCTDLAIAQLCNRCDADLTEGSADKSRPVARITHSEEFLHYAMLTLMLRKEEGVLMVRGEK